MDELGTILRETRQARGVTLQDVAQVTRIRTRYLEALEDGRYDVLPTPVHVRGFLRNYALYLNLDPDPLIARYNASRRMVKDIPLAKQVRPDRDKAPLPPPETLSEELDAEPVFFRPASISLRAPAWFSSDVLIGLFVLIVLAALVIWAGSRFIVPAITEARATDSPAAEGTELPEGTRAPDSTPGVVGFTATPTAGIVNGEPTSPPIFSSIQLEITVLDRGWLQVTVDGEVVQEGMVETGDLYAWEGAQQVYLLAGNAAGIDVTLNGQKLAPLGGRGQVVEKIWGLSGEVAPTPSLTPTASTTPPATETPAPLPGPAETDTPTTTPTPGG